jgi:hypothetical protein
MSNIKAVNITVAARSKALVFKNHSPVNTLGVMCYSVTAQKFIDGLWFAKNHVRDCHVITHALSLLYATLRLSSSRLLHVT